MRSSRRIRLVCILLLTLMVCPAFAKESTETPVFKTNKEKVSYVLGRQIAAQIRQQKLSYDLFIKGLTDALAKKASIFTAAEEKQILATDKTWRLKLKKPEMMTFDANKNYFWVMQTNKGTIKIKLMPDVAPMHVTSTIYLTNLGFYNGLTFHRVLEGFMAQGGCPLGSGSGGPGYKYGSEISPSVKHNRPYLLSMANGGARYPSTDGSQFFLTFVPTPHLDGQHTIFGEVIEGKDVVKKLEAAAGPRPSGTPTKERLVIEEATIVEEAK
jgi:peptidyl-prolyl cis-trans isomerase B (cyclophilin B)